MHVVHSQKLERKNRGLYVLNTIKVMYHLKFGNRKLRCLDKSMRGDSLAKALCDEYMSMTTALLEFCDAPVKDEETLSLTKHFPNLAGLVPSRLIIPLQEWLVVTLPATSSYDVVHRPFPHAAPTIAGWY
jgi:serine/threonine-protein kinase ATR